MRHTENAQYKGIDVVIAIGWDNPLQGYFMTVEPADENLQHEDINEESGMIYSNLDDERLSFPRLPKQLDHFRTVLREMKIETPPQFFERVEAMCD